MLLVVATVPGKPDKRQELSEVLASLAASSRSEAGCSSYAFYGDVEDPDSFVSIETWDQQSSLDAHMQQPHTQVALGRLGDLLTGAPTITVHDIASSTRAM